MTTVKEAFVLRFVREAGKSGAALDDLVASSGLDKVTVSPRLRPLERKGFIVRDGKRAGNAGVKQTVWKLAA